MAMLKFFKRLFLFSLFLTLVLQLGSATSWFFGTAAPVAAVAPQLTRAHLPLGLTFEQLHASLAQFTTDGIVTHDDIAHFISSAQRGGCIAYQLFLAVRPTPLPIKTRKAHLAALADLTAFFYLVAMLTRDDGLMPADVTFGIIDTYGRFEAFITRYRERIKQKNLDLGTEQSIFGANHLAYFRRQSHGFDEAWGINMHFRKDQPWLPLLFTGRWEDPARLGTVNGPLYHLLIGRDQHINNKFYLKPEECGIYYWREWFGHAKGYLRAVARRTVLINRLFDTDDDPPFNKEHTPRAVLQAFKKAAHLHARYHLQRLTQAERAAIRRGIAGMYTHARTHGWHDFVAYIEEHFTTPHLRHGNEIVIAPETVMWATYFATTNTTIRRMFDALAAVRRAVTSCGLRELTDHTLPVNQLREKIGQWRTAYLHAMPDLLLANGTLCTYGNRLLGRLTPLLTMDDAALHEHVARHHRQLCG